MSTKLREVIWGGRIMGAKIRAQGARERAQQAIRVADRAEAEAWSVRMEDYSGPAQPSPTIGQCINGGLAWLEVECARYVGLDVSQRETSVLRGQRDWSGDF
ncbi:hypothetical protein ACVWWO_000050 [Bradyrhizobium sp. F1.13.1]